jgi:hypothetical protein
MKFRHGTAWLGMAGQGKAERGYAAHGVAVQRTARHGKDHR